MLAHTEKVKLYTENLPEKVVTGLKLKLDIQNEEDRKELDNYFDEYSKVVTSAARNIIKARKSYKKLPVKKVDDKWVGEEGVCSSCNRETQLRWVKEETGKKLCNSCYNKMFGDKMIRKIFVPTKNRTVKSEINARNWGNISKTHYHLALKDAVELVDAIEEQKREKKRRMKDDEDKLKMFREMNQDESKRFQLPLEKGKRSFRYVHIKDKDKKLRGWTIKNIQSKIKDLEKK